MTETRRVLLALVVAAAASAAGCHDGGDDAPAAGATQTLKQFAADDIGNHTRDTADPVEINDLAIDASNEDPAQYDDLLQSS